MEGKGFLVTFFCSPEQISTENNIKLLRRLKRDLRISYVCYVQMQHVNSLEISSDQLLVVPKVEEYIWVHGVSFSSLGTQQ